MTSKRIASERHDVPSGNPSECANRGNSQAHNTDITGSGATNDEMRSVSGHRPTHVNAVTP